MKCRDCKNAIRGYFKSVPEAYVCIGTKEPFMIDDFPNNECRVYKDTKELHDEPKTEADIRAKELNLFANWVYEKYNKDLTDYVEWYLAEQLKQKGKCEDSLVDSITNADKIRTMSDEELAEFITEYHRTPCKFCVECHVKCSEGLIEWLRSEVCAIGAEKYVDMLAKKGGKE